MTKIGGCNRPIPFGLLNPISIFLDKRCSPNSDYWNSQPPPLLLRLLRASLLPKFGLSPSPPSSDREWGRLPIRRRRSCFSGSSLRRSLPLTLTSSPMFRTRINRLWFAPCFAWLGFLKNMFFFFFCCWFGFVLEVYGLVGLLQCVLIDWFCIIVWDLWGFWLYVCYVCWSSLNIFWIFNS